MNGPAVEMRFVLTSSPFASDGIGDVLMLEHDSSIYVDSVVSVVFP